MAAVFAIVALVAVWAIVVLKGKEQGWSTLKQHLGGAAAGILAMAVVINLATTNPTPTRDSAKAAAPAATEKPINPLEELRGISPNISKVEVFPQAEGKPLLLLTYTDSTIWSAGTWMSSAGMALDRILKEVTKNHAAEYSRVQVKFMVPTVDKYGNKSSEFAMRTEHTMADLLKVNWDNSTGFMMLDLADAEIKPLGLDGFREYCAEHGEYSTTFCAKER